MLVSYHHLYNLMSMCFIILLSVYICSYIILTLTYLDFSNNPYLSLSSIVSSVDDSLDPGICPSSFSFMIPNYTHLLVAGGQYMVVDCGGGTVDITVHEVSNKEGHIKEVFKATGGPYGSTSKDSSR